MNFDSDEIWPKVIEVTDSILNLISTSPQMKKQGMLPIYNIDDTIDKIFDLKLIKTTLNPTDIKNVYKKVIAHVLQNPRTMGHIEAQEVQGLELADMPKIYFEYNIWKISQLQIVSDFEGKQKIKIADLINSLQAVDIYKKLTESRIPPEQNVALVAAWKDWIRILSLRNSLSFDDDQKLLIPYSVNGTYSFKSLSTLNYIRMLVRMVLRAYGQPTSNNVWDSIMTEQRIVAWESDFREFGLKVGFLDPRQSGSAKRAFREGRFFTFSSVGQNELSSNQMMELLSMMIAGGMQTTKQMYHVLKEKNCLLLVVDVLNQRKANEACFINTFKENFSLFYSNLTGLAEQVKNNELAVEDVYRELAIISKINGKTPGTIEYAEIRSMNVVLNYLESLMAVYDLNQDQQLSTEELLRAFPRFKAMVIELSPAKEWFAEDAFLYIVYKGEIPDIRKVSEDDGWWDRFKSIWDKAMEGTKFGSFVIKRKVGTLGSVNRLNLLKVISLLKRESEKAAALKQFKNRNGIIDK